jgi:hypothetical protein
MPATLGALQALWQRLVRRPALLILAAVALAHGSSLLNHYASDDLLTITTHPAIRGGGGLPVLFTTDAIGKPLRGGASIYRPITGLTYLLDWRIGGGSPLPFHVTNLLLYGAICLLAHRLARTWLSAPGALAAALLFALFPIHVEVVANATGRSDLLCLLFALLALRLSLPGSDPPSAAAPADTPSMGAAIGAAGLYALCLLSKESLFLLPAVAAWLIYCRGPGPGRLRAYLPVVAMAAVSAAFLWFRGRYLQSTTEVAGQGVITLHLTNPLAAPQVRLDERIWTALEVLGRYLLLTLVPYEVPLDYTFSVTYAHRDLGAPLGWLGAAALLACTAAAARGLARRGATAALCGAFLGSYLIVSNLFLLVGALQANRFFFAPSLFVALLLGLLWQRAEVSSARREVRVALGAAAACALVLYAGISAWEARCWRSPMAWDMSNLRKAPTSHRALLFASRESAGRGRWPQALWYAAVDYTVLRGYPRPFHLPPAAARLPLDERLQRLPELLGLKLPPEMLRAELVAHIRTHLHIEALAAALEREPPPWRDP